MHLISDLSRGARVASVFLALVFGLSIVRCRTPKVEAVPPVSLEYPPSKRGDTQDTFHGVVVADPYRWLEDNDSEATKSWIETQNTFTDAHLTTLPTRAGLKKRLTELWNYERFSLPVKKGNRYFFSRNDGLQQQSVLYWSETVNGEPKVLLDPNALSDDGTVALSGYAISDDGKLLAYGLSDGGSDWVTWHVREVDTGSDRPDVIRWSKFSGASWLPDGSGFFYSAYDPPKEGDELDGANYYQKLYFHRLGGAQDADEVVFENPNEKTWGFSGGVTDDGDYLVVSVWRGTESKNLLYVKHLDSGQITELVSEWKYSYGVVVNQGPTFYLQTDDEAPLRRVIAVDLDDPSSPREVIAERDDVLQGVTLFGDTFYAMYLRDASSVVERYSLDGERLDPFPLSGLVSAGGFGGERDAKETFYSESSFAKPPTIYRLDLSTGESEVWRQPKVAFDPEAFVTEQVFYQSADGTRIPMFITRARDVELDGERPTYLYGYGGFNISLVPSYSPAWVAWLELGGLVAVPNIRGGGEYGREWHEAGTLTQKQNVFDDFIAAAEFLKREGYTRTERLAIAGGSNGGLLVGAVITQRPDLVAAATPAVGVMDMVRYMKFTIGWAWASDYGDPEDPELFRALYAYSPVHNAKEGRSYPATLVTTADHDDRVVPAHSFKFTAALQHAQAGPKPVMIRVETRAGHGGGMPTDKVIEERSDRYAFLVHHLGYDDQALAHLTP